MIVYRLGKSQFSDDLVGIGAKLFGARWNNVGTACLYASSSRALAVLEYTVNVNIHDIPRALSFTEIEIPDENIAELEITDLPGNWTEFPAPSTTKDFGTNLLRQATAPIIKIPSTIIPQEYNYILNPAHPDSNKFKILKVEDFIYDIRIKST
jgi:RES domain-containing protein